MFKKLITTAIIAVTAFTNANAGEIKLNVPLGAHHFGDRADGGKWNEFYPDDLAFGLSYKHYNSSLGFSINQSINSYGKHRSVYVTADYLPTVWKNKHFKVNVGGHLGFATGYKELTDSGRIPLIGVSSEIEYGRFSFQAIALPAYKEAPTTVIGFVRIKLWSDEKY